MRRPIKAIRVVRSAFNFAPASFVIFAEKHGFRFRVVSDSRGYCAEAMYQVVDGKFLPMERSDVDQLVRDFGKGAQA